MIARDPPLSDRLRRVKGQGQSATRRYWHDELGFNYRMTNICAAIGLAQIERVDAIIARKREIADVYRNAFADLPVVLQHPAPGVVSSEWLFSVLIPPGFDRARVMERMAEEGVDTRPVFYCAHHMPMYERPDVYTPGTFPVAEDVAARGISLPSFPGLIEEEIERVIAALRHALG